MDITQRCVTNKAAQPLDALADNRGAQMADVHGFGNIRAAIIYNNLAGRRRHRTTSALVSYHCRGLRRQKGICYRQIDKTRSSQTDILKVGQLLQPLCYLLTNLPRLATIVFGGGQRAVTLELGQIRAVGEHDLAILAVVTSRSKRVTDDGSKLRFK